jgi:hypothetical protein
MSATVVRRKFPPIVRLLESDPHASELLIVADDPVDQVDAELGSRRSCCVETFAEIGRRFHGYSLIAVGNGGGRCIIKGVKAALEGQFGWFGLFAMSKPEQATVLARRDD